LPSSLEGGSRRQRWNAGPATRLVSARDWARVHIPGIGSRDPSRAKPQSWLGRRRRRPGPSSPPRSRLCRWWFFRGDRLRFFAGCPTSLPEADLFRQTGSPLRKYPPELIHPVSLGDHLGSVTASSSTNVYDPSLLAQSIPGLFRCLEPSSRQFSRRASILLELGPQCGQ